MNTQTKALFLAALAVVFWSTVASAFKLSLRYLQPLQLLLLASVFSSLALMLVIAIQHKFLLLFSVSKRQLFFCFLLGLLNPGLYYFFLLEAYNRLPAQEALSINYTWPILLSLLSAVFLKHRLNKIEIAAMVLAYMGVLIVATHGRFDSLNLSDNGGLVLALISTVVFSSYWLLTIRYRSDITLTLFLSFVLSLPILTLATLWFAPLIDVNPYGVAGAAYVGCFEMGWTYLLWLSALKLSENTVKISILAFVSPVLSLLLISVVLNETVKIATWLGLLFIIGGIALRSVYVGRK